MRLQVKRCRVCRALGVGPRAVRLWPFEGYFYCVADYKIVLQWHEQREHVFGGIARLREFDKAVLFTRRYGRKEVKVEPIRWESYIRECAEMAGWAMQVADRRTFVHYFARALYAWALKHEREIR